MRHCPVMRTWATVAAVARPQHMQITTWQLAFLGVSDHTVRNRIAHHGWRRQGWGVVALPGADSDHSRLAALVLAYSKPTGATERVEATIEAGVSEVDALVEVAFDAGQVVGGQSALWLHGIASRPSKHTIRLTRGGGKAVRTGATLRRGPATGSLMRLYGLPVVDVEQAFFDLAAGEKGVTASVLHHRLTNLIAIADRLRKADVDTLSERLASAPRFVGAPALRRAIADLKGELSHSGTEKKARGIVAGVLAKYSLELHRRPFGVDHAGRTVGEADLAVLSICLDIEIDGPHHLLPAQQAKDQLRDRWMRRAGWEVERFSTELVDLWPVTFAARVDECVRFRLGK